MKSTKTIHQVYGIFDDGVPLKDITVFYENVQKTKQFCRDNGIHHKMWNLTQCNRLITSTTKKNNCESSLESYFSRRFYTILYFT